MISDHKGKLVVCLSFPLGVEVHTGARDGVGGDKPSSAHADCSTADLPSVERSILDAGPIRFGSRYKVDSLGVDWLS